MRHYIKNNIWDFFLCTVMITGVSVNVLQGFYLPAHLQTNVSAAVLCASLICLVLFACAYNNKTIVIGSILILLGIALVIVNVQTNGLIRAYDGDAESNSAVFYILTGFFSLLVFLLSRTRKGAVMLSVLGILCICAVVFMEYAHFFSAYLSFIGASLCMCFYRNYRYHALHSHTITVAFGRFAAISAIAAATILGFSVFVSVALIQPLNLSTLELKPIARYLSLAISEQSEASSRLVLPDDDIRSSITDDTTKTSNNPGSEDSEQTEYQDVAPIDQDKDTSTLNFSNWENFLYAIRYTRRERPPILFVILPFILFAFAIFAKLSQRKYWLKRTLKKDKKQQVIAFYLYYLKKLEILSYKRQPSDTPSVFAEKIHDRIKTFTVGNADILSLTSVFNKVNYGGLAVSDSEYGLFLAFHKSFYRNCREKLGIIRYGMKFFAL